MPVQDSVEDVRYQVISGWLYNLTLRVHTTACPEGSPNAEDKTACRATHTQQCRVQVWAHPRQEDRHEITVDPSCSATQILRGTLRSPHLIHSLQMCPPPLLAVKIHQ